MDILDTAAMVDEAVQQGVDVERGDSELLEPDLDEVVADESVMLGVGEHHADALLSFDFIPIIQLKYNHVTHNT
jgi:hypothetical protein